MVLHHKQDYVTVEAAAWEPETASQSPGQQGTTVPVPSSAPEHCQCTMVLQVMGAQEREAESSGLLEKHSSKHGYTATISWEGVGAPGEGYEISRGRNHRGSAGKGEQMLWCDR